MAKAATTRKKTVMQDVHADIESRIEDFTDPEKIAKARERIIDYAKVAEKFATTADLPEDDDGEFDVIPDVAAVPVAPAVLQSNLDDESLLSDIEDVDAPSVYSAQPVVDEDDINFGEDPELNDLDAIFAEMKGNEDVSATAPSTVSDLDDFDTDLLNDDDAPEDFMLGNEAFVDETQSSDTSSFPDDDDDDPFGIPSAVQTPTPYGNVAARDEDNLEDLLSQVDNDVPEAEERKMPAWMEDDDDDTDIPDILPVSSVRAADSDVGEDDVFDNMFGNDEDDITVDIVKTETHVTSSPAALNDLMNLSDENEIVEETILVEDGHIVDEVPAENIDLKKKKGLFSMFSRKKKTVIEEVDGSDEVKETVTETVVSEDEFGNQDVDVTETVTVEKPKKKNALAITAALSAIAVTAVAGGGYFLADQMGMMSQPAVVAAPVDTDRTFPPIGTDAQDTADTTTNVTVDVPEDDTSTTTVTVDTSEDDTTTTVTVDAPENDGPSPDYTIDLAPVDSGLPGDNVGTPALVIDTPTDPISPDLDIQDVTPDAADVPPLDPIMDPATDAVMDPADVGVENVEGPGDVVDPVDLGVDETAVVDAADIAVDQTPSNTFEDLYGTGVSETEITQEETQAAIGKVADLALLLNDQKAALDSALSRVQTLEAIMTERDAALATAQSEAELARQAAQEAKDMAMAQNKILIEVVGVRDKMQIAEDLIVDLSKRTALMESDNAQEDSIRQLNDRIAEMSRDIGLLARTVLTNGQNLEEKRAAQAAADRAYESAQNAVDAQAAATIAQQTQAAPSGSGSVYGNEGRLMTTPDEVEIPSTVKVGDVIEGYGAVLDISEMEDGSRLVVMENNSKILPRE